MRLTCLAALLCFSFAALAQAPAPTAPPPLNPPAAAAQELEFARAAMADLQAQRNAAADLATQIKAQASVQIGGLQREIESLRRENAELKKLAEKK